MNCVLIEKPEVTKFEPSSSPMMCTAVRKKESNENAYACIRAVCVLYTYCMRIVYVLYAYCMRSVCVLYAFCMRAVCVLYAYCMRISLSLFYLLLLYDAIHDATYLMLTRWIPV